MIQITYYRFTRMSDRAMSDARTSYRSVKPKADSGSDLESDEDTPLWQQKQEKYFR